MLSIENGVECVSEEYNATSQESVPMQNSNFLKQIIQSDLSADKISQVVTRFPPEPNGYLHIGHAKAIWINFGLAEYFKGVCHLRMDDTNPEKENVEYVQSIINDVQWLGYQWHGPLRYASQYFDQLYTYAIELINAGKAFVCELTPDETREYRGTLTESGKNSPYRTRAIEDNLRLFEEMQAGKHPEGSLSLRLKIDMASPNINMRDPVIYRVKIAHHHATGDTWNIYPMYDYAHCISDAVEGITHSLCSLEFADHKPLYDWVLNNISIDCHPQQIEFARLNTNYTITSKRKLKRLVDSGLMDGWSDPRLPTISGLRRRGYTAASLRAFCESTGLSRANSLVDMGMLEACIREELDYTAPRAMCVIRPLKVVITNYPDDQAELLNLPLHPKREELGHREITFAREVWIDQNDFLENAPRKFFRLAPGKEVRLRGAYIIKCTDAVKNAQGEITELHCTYDPETLGKMPQDRKVKGVIHWVPVQQAEPVEIRLYDRLFADPQPELAVDDDQQPIDFIDRINPDSLVVHQGYIEPAQANTPLEQQCQFEREGYFCLDSVAFEQGLRVWNRTVGLRDSWQKHSK